MTPPPRDVLIAAGECARVIGILIDSTTPHSRALAAIVSVRLKRLLTGAVAPEPLNPEEAETWLEVAVQLGGYASSGDVS